MPNIKKPTPATVLICTPRSKKLIACRDVAMAQVAVLRLYPGAEAYNGNRMFEDSASETTCFIVETPTDQLIEVY